MTTNQTIDGVPRDSVLQLIEFLSDARAYHKVVIERCNDCIKSGESSEREEYGRIGYRTEKIKQVERLSEDLRALLDSPACPDCKVCVGSPLLPKGCTIDNGQHDPASQPQGEPVAQKYDETLLPFVALMRKELHANACKGDRPGWLSMSSDTCLLEIIYHFGKLQASVKRGDGDGMSEYGADVANLCMMLLDICGVINLVQHTEQPAPVAVVRLEMAHVVRAHMEIPGCPVLTSNQCHALVMKLNACLDEVTRLNTK